MPLSSSTLNFEIKSYVFLGFYGVVVFLIYTILFYVWIKKRNHFGIMQRSPRLIALAIIFQLIAFIMQPILQLVSFFKPNY